MEHDVIGGDALGFVRTLDAGWREALVADRSQLQQFLTPLAQAIMVVGEAMQARRHVVERVDPWRQGLILAFLLQVDGDGSSRFQTFQGAGFWDQVTFNAWADEYTGVGRSTWRNWCRAARVYLLGEKGQAYLVQAGLSPRQFIERTPVDKALRACATLVRDELEPHQLEALVDESVTVEGMRHALRVTAGEWEQEQERQAAVDAEWIERGDGCTSRVEYDPACRVLRLSFLEDGDWKKYVVARFPVPSHPRVEEAQRRIIEAMEEGEI